MAQGSALSREFTPDRSGFPPTVRKHDIVNPVDNATAPLCYGNSRETEKHFAQQIWGSVAGPREQPRLGCDRKQVKKHTKITFGNLKCYLEK